MSASGARVPLLGLAAFSGTGKTTLLRRLLPLLTARGLRVAVIKHAHHSFDLDKPGKDSYELRKAGACRMLVASRNRRALVEETPGDPEPRLAELLAGLRQDDLDLVLVEGFKHESFPKIELHRPGLGRPLLFPDDPSILAVATDGELPESTRLPVLPLNDARAIADFVVRYAAEGGHRTPASTPAGGPP
jgi:molybdopterin-guanine dinucleotide biosynthesis protein MobB